jgi:hypothetical protein
VKLALLKLQHEEFLQSIAELCGQPRKPQIPKEAPTAVRDELKLKIRVRISFIFFLVVVMCLVVFFWVSWLIGLIDLPPPQKHTQLPSMAAGEERRKKRQREELEGAGAGGRGATEQAALNPEQERMRRPVAWGFKEKEGALATPDYLPSFMEVR